MEGLVKMEKYLENLPKDASARVIYKLRKIYLTLSAETIKLPDAQESDKALELCELYLPGAGNVKWEFARGVRAAFDWGKSRHHVGTGKCLVDAAADGDRIYLASYQ